MPSPLQIPLRVGHQPEDPTRRVTDPRDPVHRAIDIHRCAQHHLATGLQTFNNRWPGNKSPLAVRDRKLHHRSALASGPRLREPLRPDTPRCRLKLHPDPSRLEPTRYIGAKPDNPPRARIRSEPGQQPALDEHLKSVTHPENARSASHCRPQPIREPPADVHRHDPARSHIIPIRKSARQPDQLDAIKTRGIADQGIKMDQLSLRPGQREPTEHFLLAIRPSGPDDQSLRHLRTIGHGGLRADARQPTPES